MVKIITWPYERPAPTVVGTRRTRDGVLIGRRLPDGEGRDPEVFGGWSGSVGLRSGQLPGVPVTIAEAGLLQSFPENYPWRGNKVAQCQQVGNAIPPLLARAVLGELNQTKERNMPTPGKAIDLFAGPGGWDVAARDLGLEVLGIEFDHAACETRRAAGLPTVEGDVRDHRSLVSRDHDFAGLIASPPCQTFSTAGKGAGRAALDDVLLGVKTLAARQHFDASVFSDERTGLVLEPLVWALTAIDAGCPFQWIALEQVPTVLPVWEAYAEVLRAEGYSVATGNLHAEQYGVPQTRKRAVLVARIDGEAKLPTPTHSRYYNRTPEKLDDGVLPWVYMAEALGWTADVSTCKKTPATPKGGAKIECPNCDKEKK